MTYANVVRHMRKIGDWTGEPLHFEMSREDLASPDSDSYVLVLQAGSENKPGPILAALLGDQIK